MKHTADFPSGQLTLFQIAPTPTIKTIHDPYWDEVEEIAPEQPAQNQAVAVGDRVKISLEWMDKCASAADRRYHKYYQHKNPKHDLTCIVRELHESGGVYVARGPNRFLYVPERYFEIAPEHHQKDLRAFEQISSKIHDNAPLHLGLLSVPGDFIPESVREQDTSNDCAVRKSAPEHIHWLEQYWVKRGNKKHHYYRYCWMTGRKINRIHIGSVSSAIAQNRKSEIELAINDGQTPLEIGQLIRQQRCV